METFFHFKFENPFGFLLPFIPAIINLALVAYIYFFFVKNRITTVFSFLTLTLACWQLNSAAGRIAYDETTAAAWEYFFLVPWSMVGPLCLHFALLYTQIIDENKWRPLLIISYLITFFFIGIYNTGIYEHHFVYYNFWGWVDEHKDNVIDIISISWLSFLTFFSIIILLAHTFRNRRNGEYFYQSLLIATGITTPAVIGIFSQLILPIIFHVESIPVTSIFMSVFSITTVIALSKYNLFRAADIYDLEKLLDRIPSYLICINEDEKINYINEYACNQLKLLKKHLINVHVSKAFQFTSNHLNEKFTNTVKDALDGKESINFETTLLITNQVIHTLMSIRPITIESKIHGVIINIRDITEVYKTHERIEKSEQQLKDAQKIAQMGSWEWEINNNCVTWSDEIYNILNVKNISNQYSYKDFLQFINHAEQSNINELIQQSFNNKESFSFTQKIGDHKFIRLNGQVLVNLEGQVTKMYGTIQDVSSIVEKENTLKLQNEELHKINSELDRFVYSVSHDLRSPLASIEGLVNIASDETQDPNMKQYLEMIQSSTIKLDKFISDILHYSRNARMDITLEKIDVNQFINEVLTQNKAPIQSKLKIKNNIKEAFPFISDKTRLLIILNNLISNSIRYANYNLDEPIINIEINIYMRKVYIKVSDNGQGIDEKILPRIFEMFFRGHRDSIGSGLGLYIVKEAIEKLKGKITVQSKVGIGSVFTIELPNHQHSVLQNELK